MKGWGPSPLKDIWADWMMTNRLRAWAFAQIETETETLPDAPTAAPAAEPKPEETPSALEDAKDQADARPDCGGAEPPKEGPCRECRRFRPLNRLKLCYACFVVLNLIDQAKARGEVWKPGMPHPKWCDCEGLGEHPERDHGAWRGN